MGILRGGTMWAAFGCLLVLTLLVGPALAARSCESDKVEHRTTFRSPGIKIRPGDVKNKFFEIESPPGHFATRDFDAELVLENGEPVPLTEVYLHHWIMVEYAVPKDQKMLVGKDFEDMVSMNPAQVYHGGAGVGDAKKVVRQNWAKGAETRHLNSTLPAPYGLESGNTPEGYHSQWLLNVHGIDTRGAAHRMGCTECRCDLFTGGNRSREIPDGYTGGLRCCVDESRCLLKDDFNGDDANLQRTIYLQYTWTYVTYDDCVVSLAQFGMDVTNQGQGGTVEYTVEGSCKAEDFLDPKCVDVRETVLEAKYGGDVVYAVSHLHAYSLDSTLWGEDGRLICHSPPIYGSGSAAGDEKGYVVGIMHCNPSFAANGGKIKQGEKLRYQVKYTKVDGPHTGVMGVMFVKLAPDAEIATSAPLRHGGNRKLIN